MTPLSREKPSMTDLPTRLSEAKDAVVKAARVLARKYATPLLDGLTLSNEALELRCAEAQLAAIEAEIERSRKPRLRSVTEAVGVFWTRCVPPEEVCQIAQGYAERAIAARDTEWLEKAEKLPRYVATRDIGEFSTVQAIDCISLSDLKSLKD